MFDFPNSPTVGQVVTGGNGASYQWDGVKWDASSAITGAAANNVGRNLIHNSMFNIAQRGVGMFATPGAYTLDRWVMNATGDTFTCGQFAAGDGARTQTGDEATTFYFSCSFTGTAGATANTNFVQRIEGLRRVSGKTVTLSFWTRTGNATPKVGVNMAQNFGTGGSPSATVLVQATGISFALTAEFTRYSCTFIIPSSAGKTFGTNNNDFLSLLFYFSAGANTNAESGNIGVQASGNIELWGVQLEIGNVATPLEKLDPRIDFENCQRFYQKGFFDQCAYMVAGNSISSGFPFSVQMRASPTVTTSNTVLNNATGLSVSSWNNSFLSFGCIATASSLTRGYGEFQASADL